MKSQKYLAMKVKSDIREYMVMVQRLRYSEGHGKRSFDEIVQFIQSGSDDDEWY